MATLPEPTENVEEEIGRVKLALQTVFYSKNDHVLTSNWWDQRKFADRYLTRFQGSTVAWMVCDRLLQDNSTTNNPEEVRRQQQHRFFAAQTLHTKCRVDVFQLPPSSLASLRDSLMVHLDTFSMARDVALTNRLAMAVSALAVQMAWTTVVADLLSLVYSDPQKRAIVMQIFKVLAEECASDRLILIDENERYYMRDHLVSTSAEVFRFIESWDGAPKTAYEVLFTWIRYVPVRPDVLLATPLLEASFNALLNKESMELAADVVVEIYRMYPSCVPSNYNLVQKMIPLSSKLPFDQALSSGDDDVLQTYCRVITEMAESYMSIILSTQYQEASQLVEWVLRCSSIPYKHISSITLNFWYRMVTNLETIEPFEFRQDLIDQYTPYLLQLIGICSSTLMKYPEDVDELFEDEMDDINSNRFYTSETVEDCCRLIGGHIVLERLGTQLQQEVQSAGSKAANSWQGIESSLMCMMAISKFIPSDEATFLPFCFEMLPRLPTNVNLLRCTASKIIGKYPLWLMEHPHLLQPLMPFLAQGLSIPSCSAAAAVSIKELCLCSNNRMQIGEPVLQLYTEISASPGHLALKDELEVLEGACRAISRQVLDTKVDGSNFVQKMIQPIGDRLATKAADPNSKAKQDIIPELDRLTIIVRFLTIPGNGVDPRMEIIQSVWPILDGLSTRFAFDNALAEKVCRFHKYAVRSCGASVYEPMLEPLMKQLVQSYERSRQSAYLYAASICITEYGADPKHTSNLFDMIQAMASVSFSFLGSLEDLTHHPDVVEELFYLMGRMVTYCPEPLVKSPLLRALFQCAIVGMKLDHRDANKGTLNFLESIIWYGITAKDQGRRESQQAFESVLALEGQNVVNNLAASLMGDLPAHSIDTGSGSIAGVLWKLNMFSPAVTTQWVTSALSSAPERSRAEFLGIIRSGVARKDFNAAIRGFMNTCKRERKLATRQ